MEVSNLPDEEANYIHLLEPSERLHIEVQSVSHPSRVHLDIETTTSRPRCDGSRRSGHAGSEGQDVVGHGGAHWPAVLRRPAAGEQLCGGGQHVGVRAVAVDR